MVRGPRGGLLTSGKCPDVVFGAGISGFRFYGFGLRGADLALRIDISITRAHARVCGLGGSLIIQPFIHYIHSRSENEREMDSSTPRDGRPSG